MKRLLLIGCVLLAACAHHVTVPKQADIPSPIIGHTVCIDPADPTGHALIPCRGGR